MGVVGIDLGTTNTVVACVRGGAVHVVADEHGRTLLPSVVNFHPNGQILVGAQAKERRAQDPENTIFSVKRLIGRAWKSEELAIARTRFGFKLEEAPGGGAQVAVRGHTYSLPEISAFVLRRARQIAEQALGEPVDRAVITVPANFNELQRAATKLAGRIAGLDVLRILNEPTAAALTYGVGRSGKERVAVYDFGGGTFDATLLDLSGTVFEVLATAGDTFLGGDDIDLAIADRMAAAFLMQHRYDLRANPEAWEYLRDSAEQLKMQLSTRDRGEIRLHDLAFGSGGKNLDFTFGMSLAEIESIASPYIERTLEVTREALALQGLSPSLFDHTILVGGSTRMPLVARRVADVFGKPPLTDHNPDEVVAMGAAIQAAALTEAARKRSVPPPPPPRPKLPTLKPPANFDPMGGAFGAPPPRPKPPSNEPGPPPAFQPLADFGSSPTTADDFGSPADGGPGELPAYDIFGQPLPADTESLPDVDDDPFDLPIDEEITTPSYDLPDDLQPKNPRLAAPSAPRIQPFAELPKGDAPASYGRAARQGPGTSPMQTPVVPAPAGTQPMGRVQTTQPMAKTPSQAPKTAPIPVRGPSAYPPAPQGVPGTAAPMPRPGPAAPILVDVTPRALVVETAGGFCDVIIPRNSRIPCDRTREFTTARDFQTAVSIRVAQGEAPHFGANTFLGQVDLLSLRSAARGEVVIAVTFELDANGLLRVEAIDRATGKRASAVLQLVGIADENAVASLSERHDALAHRVTGRA
ncbi:MAG: Hsp70 family protein [Polyangiaceae bacterium]